jgi:selenocysteine lyase/cysteine desulfurase
LIARLLNADRTEIALVENATVAWDMAFYSVGFTPGDRILVAEDEYVSNHIAFLRSRDAAAPSSTSCRAMRPANLISGSSNA